MSARVILHKLTRKLANICLISFFGLFFQFSAHADPQKTLVINSGSTAPLIISMNEGFYPALVKELFRRSGIDTRTIKVPSARSLRNANEGVDDGVIARIKGIEKKFGNLVMVPEKVIDLGFLAFTNDKSIQISKWEDLEPYKVAYVRGWKLFDNNVKNFKSIDRSKNARQLFDILKHKRVDVILYQDIPGKYLMKEMNYFPNFGPNLVSKEMFLYMHKRHVELIPKLAMELRKMKQDGSYQSLYETHIAIPLSSVQ